jgi:hypothetical protein
VNKPRDRKLRKTYLPRKVYVASQHHDLTRARRQKSMTLNFCNQLHWYLQPGSLVGTLGRAWAWRVSHRCLQSTGRGNWRRWRGVDGIIEQDCLGLDRIYVQAKRYAERSKARRWLRVQSIALFFPNLAERPNRSCLVSPCNQGLHAVHCLDLACCGSDEGWKGFSAWPPIPEGEQRPEIAPLRRLRGSCLDWLMIHARFIIQP